jgi:hypothetical protein
LVADPAVRVNPVLAPVVPAWDAVVPALVAAPVVRVNQASVPVVREWDAVVPAMVRAPAVLVATVTDNRDTRGSREALTRHSNIIAGTHCPVNTLRRERELTGQQ